MVARIKENDMVMVISGKDKGKTGTVLDISHKDNTVLVKGVAVITRHIKPRRQGETGSIRKEESYIHLSKVMPLSASSKKPCRVNVKVLENGKRVRVCNHAKEVI